MNVRKSLVFLLVSVMILVTMGLSTIPTVGAASLPTHVITGYWQDFNNGATCLKLASVPTSYGIIAVAFANSTATPGAVDFSIDSGLASALGGYTAAQFTADVATCKARGQKVVISIGGQNGTISVSDATSATNFANSVYTLMTTYGFDGVDIDLENGLNATYMTSALQQLSSKAGSSLIITMAPQTIDMQSPSNTYFQTCLNIKSILTVVNMQYYNSGSMLGYNGQVYSEGNEDFLTALATIQLEGGLDPSQVGLGLPASTSAAGSGYVAPSVVNNAIDCLYNNTNCGSYIPPHKYPNIRGAMTWSINWDATNGYNWVNTIYPHLSALGGGSTSTPAPTSTPTPTPGATATPNGSNIALGKAVTVSSVETAGYEGNLAVDGNTTTRWSTAWSDPQWIYVDLGSNYSVNRVVLNWEAAYATAYKIQVSTDATNWTDVYSTTTSTGGVQSINVSGTGRYVRMYGTARGTTYGYSLWEFEVYGTPSGATPTPTPTPAATATPGPTSTPTPTPAATATPTPGGIAAWAPNTAYSVNQLCTYGGSTYKCLQAHTSQVGWEPPNVPALWQLQ